jgi:protein gp37
MKLAGTRLKHHESRAGLTRESKAGPVWTGEVRLNKQWLHQPIDWKKPRRIFVCAHGDLFAENVPDEWILDVFTVMAIASQHTFQVLTKRPDRMREFLSRPDLLEDIYANWYTFSGGAREVHSWPLHNVWCGASAEDQLRYDSRRRHLEETPTAVRFWSIEPMLAAIDLKLLQVKPHLVIVGGESGQGARPIRHPDWVRSIRDQCATAGIPFFFKQWGAHLPAGQMQADRRLWSPSCGSALHATKAITGRLLDGVEHSAMPELR